MEEKRHPTGAYEIRRMRREEAALAVEWAANEGWDPGLDDGELFYDTDPDGFFIGELSGLPIGTISAVAYDDTFGFIGLYIVRPEYRGQGFGIRLWKKALEYLGDRNIGLDGVLAQQANYERSGFRLAYSNLRYEGAIAGKADPHVIDLERIPFEKVSSYDSRIFPVPRPDFLKRWISQPLAVALGYLEKGALAGYGVMRECRVGYKIGPLFADNEEAAESLLLALALKAAGTPVYLDVPEVNNEAVSLAERHGMHICFKTVRMYTKMPYLSGLERVFGVTTFELG